MHILSLIHLGQARIGLNSEEKRESDIFVTCSISSYIHYRRYVKFVLDAYVCILAGIKVEI